MQNTRPRSLILDVIRIFAAGWVLVYHWNGGSGYYQYLDWQFPIHQFPGWFDEFARTGFLGVDIFFVLSGAVIGRSAIGKSWDLFARSRFLRLFPAFVAATLLTMAITGYASSVEVTTDHTLSVFGLFFWVGGESPVGPSWTLAFEVGFYALIALAIARYKVLDSSTLIRLTDIYVLFLVATWTFDNQLVQLLSLNQFAAQFALGVYLAQSTTREATRENAIRIIVASVLSVVLISNRLETIMIDPTLRLNVAVAVVAGMVILVLVAHRMMENENQPRWSGSLATLSLMTYPFYLLHQEVGMNGIVFFHWSGMGTAMAMVSSFAVVALLSYLSVKFFEPLARQQIARWMRWV
jgi:peptidoglycan/LPS O-acetylase OafA/YrhL